MSTLFTYCIPVDDGAAPNPYWGICTLVICKPAIRRTAQVGDWVVGTGSKTTGREKHLVYAMRVTGVLAFEQYLAEPHFQCKKPNLRGSKKQAFGDNIYSRDPATGRWRQANSHHSINDESPNPKNVKTDTGTNRILFSDDFVYFGGAGPEIPIKFRNWGSDHKNVCAVFGHKNQFPPKMVEALIAWIRSLNESGYCGEPLDWPGTP